MCHDPRVVLWLCTAANALAGVLIGAGRLQHAGRARRGPTEALLTPRRSMPHFFILLPLASFWWSERGWLVFVLIVGRQHYYSVPMPCFNVCLYPDICQNERLRSNSCILLYAQVVPCARLVYCRGLW